MQTNVNNHVLTTLQEGTLNLQGEFVWGSNYTFLIEVEFENESLQAVYKPTQGERPLWDFPKASLAKREVAAYLVSQALEWNFVPPTVLREDGPFGPGSLQLFVEHDPEYHYFNFSEQDRQRLRPVVLFDVIVNNADRKGSHILFDPDEQMWLIDHGLCFNVNDKLRTVIWDFAGEPISERFCNDLGQFRKELDNRHSSKPGDNLSPFVSRLCPYLSQGELTALGKRIDQLLSKGIYPGPDPNRRHYPWPPA
jgi:uncharacterized repeat protein (TIGR03843 family)